MNLTVHSIMYAWYALAAANNWLAKGLKPTRLFSQTVTVLQIVQMVGGTAVTTYVWFEHDAGCKNELSVVRCALGMYTVYLLLFIHFFKKAYCTKKYIITDKLEKPPFAKEGGKLLTKCAKFKDGVSPRMAG